MGSSYKALVAFTDVVKDAKDGQEYTEAKMNGFPVKKGQFSPIDIMEF